MPDLERRGGRRLTRREKEQRAYALVIASGVLGILGLLGIVLTAVGVLDTGLPVLLLLLSGLAFYGFRRTID